MGLRLDRILSRHDLRTRQERISFIAALALLTGKGVSVLPVQLEGISLKHNRNDCPTAIANSHALLYIMSQFDYGQAVQQPVSAYNAQRQVAARYLI